AQAGNVVRLARCHERDGAFGEFRTDERAGNVRQRIVEDEVAMDLVGNEQQVVLATEGAEFFQFVAAPDAGEGVVRVAEVVEFGGRCDGGGEGVPIEFPTTVTQLPGNAYGAAIEVAAGGEEGRIDGRESQVVFAGLSVVERAE